jgi:hypothetical protein
LNCLADPDVRASIESLYRQYQWHYVKADKTARSQPPKPVRRIHSVSRRLAPEAIDQLADYIGGESAKNVARRYGISKDAALRRLHKRGVVRAWGTNQHRDEQDHFTTS